MRYRKLGTSGIEVSEIGFGAWGIGGPREGVAAYGPTDDGESRRALRRAHELGVNFFDTADLYGLGHSESLIGEALQPVRDSVAIATKVGFLGAGTAQDFSPARIRRALEASLTRLRTQHVDLYQLHSPDPSALTPEVLETLEALRREGKVRATGISVRSPDEGHAALDLGLRVLQVNFNLADQRALRNGLFARARALGAAIVVRTPLCFGFLTGRYPDEATFADGDHRGRWPLEQRRRWRSAYDAFEAALGALPGTTRAQQALRFCLSYRAVSTVIPGMLDAREVEENALTAELPLLSEAALREIESAYARTESLDGSDRRRGEA